MNELQLILLGILIDIAVVGKPEVIKYYTNKPIGKFIFLVLTLIITYYNRLAGILLVAIYIVIRSDIIVTETMKDKDNDNDNDNDNSSFSTTDFVKKYCKDGELDSSLNPPTLKYKSGKCNPCDDSCDFEITSAKEQITVDEALRPKESNSIPV